jgi:hypothetical protein
MSMRSFGAFGPEAIVKMSEVLDAAFEKLQDTGEPDVVREGIAMRIIAAARFGERDPARLLEAAHTFAPDALIQARSPHRQPLGAKMGARWAEGAGASSAGRLNVRYCGYGTQA